MVRRIVAALLAAAVLAPVSTRAATESVPPCPGDGFQPLEAPYSGPGLAILIPPLAILQALARDPLASEPRRALSFRVLDGDGRPADTAHVALLRDGRRFIGETLHGGTLELPAGTYTVIAAVGGTPGRWGQRRIVVGESGPSDFEVKMDRVLPKVATKPPSDLAPDGRAPAGGPVHFAWSGIRQPVGTLAVTAADEEGGKALREAPIGSGATSAIEMPAGEGSYDVRLLMCAPRVTLATWRVEVGPPQIRLTAPDKVAAGRTFDVAAAGRIGGEFELAVVRAGTEDEIQSEKATRAAPRAKLTAPLAAGAWEVVYRADDDDHTVLARRPLSVEAGTIELSAPSEVKVGQKVKIAYPGSETGAGAVLGLWSKDGVRLGDDLQAEGQRLPAAAGDYELRLFARADPSTVLARRPIRIVGTMIQAPETVAAGSRFTVTLTQEPAFFDKLHILQRGKVPEYFEKGPSAEPSDGGRAEITAAVPPGDYDLVLVDETPGPKGAITIDRRPLTVR